MLTHKIALVLPLLAATVSAQQTKTQYWVAEAYGHDQKDDSAITLDLSVSTDGVLSITGGKSGSPVWLLGAFDEAKLSLKAFGLSGDLLLQDPFVLGVGHLDAFGEFSAKVPADGSVSGVIYTQAISLNEAPQVQISQGLRFEFLSSSAPEAAKLSAPSGTGFKVVPQPISGPQKGAIGKPGVSGPQKGDTAGKPGVPGPQKGDTVGKPGVSGPQKGDTVGKPGDSGPQKGDTVGKPGDSGPQKGDGQAAIIQAKKKAAMLAAQQAQK